MSNSIWIRLVVPLTLLFMFALFMNLQWEAGGFFINLATEVIGIVLTISYVNWVLETREKKRWQTTDKRVTNRILILLNGIVSSIRNGRGIPPDIIDNGVFTTGNMKIISKEVIRAALEIIFPVIYQQVIFLREEGWQRIAVNLRSANHDINAFLERFQSRLSPDQITTLLDIQEELEHSLIFYETFPDLAGVPKDKLPKTRTPPEQLQQHGYESTAIHLQRTIELCSKLSRMITMNVPSKQCCLVPPTGPHHPHQGASWGCFATGNASL